MKYVFLSILFMVPMALCAQGKFNIEVQILDIGKT